MRGRIRGGLKRLTPPGIWRPVSDTYWWWMNRGRHQAASTASLQWRRSKKRIATYAGKHHGQRCFILGNGPSLRRTDLSLLRSEHTFGLNRIYLLFDETGFKPTYYVAINTLVVEQFAEDIESLDMPRFITWRARKWLSADPGTIYLDTDYTGVEDFSTELTSRVYEGGTVTYVALQLAYWMGFEEVVLLGVDHSYTTEGPANETVVSHGEDPNHFDADYFGKGSRWQLPDLAASQRAYTLAKHAYASGGRRILDATIEGQLTVFPKVDYLSLFGDVPERDSPEAKPE